MAIRIPLIQINGRLQELPEGDKFHTEVIENFEYTQEIPEEIWEIEHNMDKYPSSVTILTEEGYTIYGQIQYNSKNKITLSFSRPITGMAIIS